MSRFGIYRESQEPTEVVVATILKARMLDYPPEKITIIVCDDGGKYMIPSCPFARITQLLVIL